MKITNKIKISLSVTLFVALTTALVLAYISQPVLYISPYPAGKNFAFTITDDPDGAQLEKIKPVYALLDKLGFKTTMACWVYKPDDVSGMPDPQEQLASETLQDGEYLKFLNEYKDKGFEIALHTVTSGNDKRDVTIKGYERFKEVFGKYPEINIMHSKNKEDIYWGRNVFKNPIMRSLVSLYDRTLFSGEGTKSPYFWGDICKEKTKYVRLWGTSDINTLKFNPSMPYHDSDKPYVNYWFSFSDGYTAKYFYTLISPKNVERLVKERGACIVYTHFAAGFAKKIANGRYEIEQGIKNRLENLSIQKEGWFVPAGVLLDRLAATKNILMVQNGKRIDIVNRNTVELKGLTLIVKPFVQYQDESGAINKANADGEILLGTVLPGQKRTVYLDERVTLLRPTIAPVFFETNRMILQRVKIMLFSHRG